MGEKKEKKSKKKDKAEKAEAEAAAEAPAEEAAPAPAKESSPSPVHEAPKKKHTGNVFALFNKAQIQEFKEAFTMIDQNRDGIICENDIAAMFQQTGREADDKTIKTMLAESPGTLNFTNFLTLFGEKLHGTDPERTLLEAFKMFDEQGTGILDEAYFKELLTEVGDLFTKDEVKQTWKECPIEGGKLDYNKFTMLIKRGNQEDLG